MCGTPPAWAEFLGSMRSSTTWQGTVLLQSAVIYDDMDIKEFIDWKIQLSNRLWGLIFLASPTAPNVIGNTIFRVTGRIHLHWNYQATPLSEIDYHYSPRQNIPRGTRSIKTKPIDALLEKSMINLATCSLCFHLN